MKCHARDVRERARRAGMRVTHCRHRVVAVGIDRHDVVIDIATNQPYLRSRGRHAEERLLYRAPPTLRKILIGRLSAAGVFLPIDPCAHCAKIASRKGVTIVKDYFL